MRENNGNGLMRAPFLLPNSSAEKCEWAEYTATEHVSFKGVPQ